LLRDRLLDGFAIAQIQRAPRSDANEVSLVERERCR
jgi:hypothetical protein